MLPDYFQILEIPREASEMEIKLAFRKKSKELHPSINKSPDALDKFILVYEAYEILIHKNTHQIYLEDYNTAHDPLKYEVYYYWINVARTRAAQHANVSLNEYLNSKFYKSTHVTLPSVLWMYMIFGVILMTVPYLMVLIFGPQPLMVGFIIVGLMVGTWFVVQASSGFQMTKKYMR